MMSLHAKTGSGLGISEGPFFFCAPSPHRPPQSLLTQCSLRKMGKKVFFMNLVVKRHIVMVQQRTEDIPSSQNGALGSRAPNDFPVLQALLVGNGSKSHHLPSAEGRTRRHLAFRNSSQFRIRTIISLFGKKCRPSGVKTKTSPGQ